MDRLTAFGNQLVAVHIWLREQLADLRANVKTHPTRDLRAHCLTFCTALTRHHEDENSTAFPAIEAEHPELREIITELKADHERIEALLTRLDELLTSTSDPVVIRSEVDTLAALMETHFTYEEKRLLDALNKLNKPEWHTTRPDFLERDACD